MEDEIDQSGGFVVTDRGGGVLGSQPCWPEEPIRGPITIGLR